MVAPDEGHAIGVADLEAEQEEEGFEGIETTVDEVTWRGIGSAYTYWAVAIAAEGGEGVHTHEQVVGVRHVATHSKEFH